MILFLAAIGIALSLPIIVIVDEKLRARRFRQRHEDVFAPKIARTKIYGDGAWFVAKPSPRPRPEAEPRGM